MNKEEIIKYVSDNFSDDEISDIELQLNYRLVQKNMSIIKENELKKESKFKYIVETINEFHTNELDYELFNDLFTSEEINKMESDDDYPGNFIKYLGNGDIGHESMKISELENIIERFKNNGCNYIEIDYHEDHLEYKFEGVKISKIK